MEDRQQGRQIDLDETEEVVKSEGKGCCAYLLEIRTSDSIGDSAEDGLELVTGFGPHRRGEEREQKREEETKLVWSAKRTMDPGERSGSARER
jgi:hypothetical protein